MVNKRNHKKLKVPKPTPEQKECIGRNIYYLRKKKFPYRGGSKECAEDMKIYPQQLGPWEKGLRIPQSKNLKVLADYFGVEVEYFFIDHKHPKDEGTDERENPVSMPSASITQRENETRAERTKDNVIELIAESTGTDNLQVNEIDLPIPSIPSLKNIKLKYKGNISIIGVQYISE